MGNSESMWWIVVEIACRILGVSTATVLFGVGVETIQRGEFSSLGIYLITSSIGIMMFELAFFLDALLSMCLLCPPNWPVFVLWGKMAHVGGFHKFLYYSIMSVVCFLHPVLVWHAVIPGSMLLVTALFNFILSKKTKNKFPKSPLESNNDRDATTVCVMEGSDPHSAFSFFQTATGRRGEGSADHCLGPDMLEHKATPEGADKRRRRNRTLNWLGGGEEPVEWEMEEIDRYSEPEPDTTSDTAPMITD